MKSESLIWFPLDSLYEPRTDGGYERLVSDVSLVELTSLVQHRAQEDGNWAIENGLVGENNANRDKMVRMMQFVGSDRNIQQCVGHLIKDGEEDERTVDWVCRDLAKASKALIR